MLDKSKIIQISRENGGERYTKRFDIRVHLVVMPYAVIMRFDSLREIAASLLAEARKLSRLGLTRSMADANKRRPKHIFEEICRQLYGSFRRTAKTARRRNGWGGSRQ